MVETTGRGSAKRERERQKANEQYFLSLADSRASLTSLPAAAIACMFFLGLTQLLIGSAVYEGNENFLVPFWVNNAIIGLCFLTIFPTVIKPLVYRFQVFFTALLVVLVSFLGYAMCLMAWSIGTLTEAGTATLVYSSEVYTVFGFVAVAYISGACVVQILLLRHRLRVGYSEDRTMGNFLAVSSVYSSKSLWIIFAIALIGPNLLTGGQYIMLTIGGLGFLFFASVFPSLPVEFGYLTYLKARDKKYWEQRPPKIVIERAKKIRTLKKTGKVTLIIIAVIVVVAVLNDILPRIF